MSSTPPASFPGLALLADGRRAADGGHPEAGDGSVTDLVTRWWRAAEAGRPLAPGIHAELEPIATGAPPATGDERQVSTDHANLSIATGEVLVKFLADPVPGVRPGVASSRHLAAVDDGLVPALLGTLVGSGPRGPRLLATATRYLGVGVEGWARFRDLARDHLTASTAIDASVTGAEQAGALVARFHVASATASPHRSDPVTALPCASLLAWVTRAEATTAAARRADRADADRCTAIEGRLARARSDLAVSEAAVATTPGLVVHGDLHVGQLLWVGDEPVLTDLDGDPTLPHAERDRPAPAAKDLAALLRSLDHAGRLAALRSGAVGLDDPRVDAWIRAARRAAANAYTEELRTHDAAHLLDRSLVAVFESAQLGHELHYAATRLREWQPVARAAADAWLQGRMTDAT